VNAEGFGAMDKLMIAVCTVPNRETAEELSKSVLQGRMAACVSQVDNIRSAYWWQGSVERAEEILLLIKTTSQKVESLKQFVSANHPYETPELVFISCDDALEAYVNWVRLETRER
jgi:periplasmic divalent cation tolerance protein